MDDENTNYDSDGIQGEDPILSLDLDDRELVQNFERWISESESYWNKANGYNLKNVRKKNLDYFLGNQVDKSKLYNHQVPYIDNVIFAACQTIFAYLSGNTPSAESVPEDDSKQSRVMSKNLESALNVICERQNMKQKLKIVVKNLYLKRLGVMKFKYDALIDDINIIALDPSKLILDKDCLMGEEPKFIAEICTDTVAELMRRFPEKEDKILEALGRERKTNKLMGKLVEYKEVWFTDETSNEEDRECVAWYFNKVILDKVKNPNFLYSKEGLNINNFVDKPTKPYVFFNYINDGTSLIDQTSPLEQAIPLQDVLNKRGRQIIENADTANALKIFKSDAITAEEAQDLTGDPNQAILLDTEAGRPLTDAFGEMPPHLLPNYVLQDKQDLKSNINNILGTPAEFRGDSSDNANTLGQAQMLYSQASGRQNELVSIMEDGMNRVFKLLVQMMKVYYTKTKSFSKQDNDGNFINVELSRETIPNVANVLIRNGTLQAPDKKRNQDIAVSLAKMGLIDPYNLFKDMGLENPTKRYEALVKFKTDPTLLLQEVNKDVEDEDAYVDFALIMNNTETQPREDITPEHIEAHRQQLMTDRFLYAEPKLQQKFINHIENEVTMFNQRMKLDKDAQEGILTDPNTPVGPIVPEPMPEQPQQPLSGGGAPQAGGQPPIPPQQGKDSTGPAMGVPNEIGNAITPSNGDVLRGLIPPEMNDNVQ